MAGRVCLCYCCFVCVCPSWTTQRSEHCDISRPSYSNQKIKVPFFPAVPLWIPSPTIMTRWSRDFFFFFLKHVIGHVDPLQKSSILRHRTDLTLAFHSAEQLQQKLAFKIWITCSRWLVMNGLIRYSNKVKVVMGIMSHIGLFMFSVEDNGLEVCEHVWERDQLYN